MENKKGPSQGDFSRFLFDPRRHYSAVHMQQGRVLLDADWNEQVDIASHRVAIGTIDAVGASGAPAGNAGFGVRIESSLELGPGGHFVVIGEEGGLAWRTPPAEQGGFTLELRVRPASDGVLLSRWTRGETGFEPAEVLSLSEGRLRFQRSGAYEELAGAPVARLDRVLDVAVVCHGESVALYLDGETVAAGTLPGPSTALAGSYLLLAATLHEGRPQRQLSGLFFELRLWGVRRSRDEIRAGLGRQMSGREEGLLGSWSFTEGSGTTVHDRAPDGNHGVVRGSGEPPRWHAANPIVTAGRYYVDGLLCEIEEDVPFDRQPDFPGAVFPASGRHLFYLDVWQRSISAVEDPSLREIALGGPTTTTRSRTVAQVKSLPVAGPADDPDGPAAAADCPEWRELLARARHRGRLRAQRRLTASAALDNFLYRVEIHHGGGCYGHRPALGTPGDDSAAVHAAADDAKGIVADPWQEGWRVGQPVELFSPERDGGEPGQMAVIAAVEPERRLLVLDREPAAERRGDADLRLRPLASFKWSRDNASEVFPIATLAAENKLVTLGAVGQGELCLHSGENWVEVVDDVTALRQEPAPLCQVSSFDASKRQAILRQSPPEGVGTDPARHPLLRVWNQSGPDLTFQGLAVARCDAWQKLESGIEILFADDGAFVSGDFWWIVARHVTQDVEWPRDDDRQPLALPPHGVAHHLAPLAFLSLEDHGFHLTELRRTFHALTSGAVSKAGDFMEGPLDVRADLKVRGDLEVGGAARIGEIYGRLASHGVVETPNLADGAVTLRKLAREVGVVPAGFSILGPTPEAPPGFVYTGAKLSLFADETRWTDRLEVPSFPPGPVASAAAGGKVYCFQGSGEVWELDPDAGAWRRRREMPWHRRRFAVAAVAGKIFVIGGLDATGRCRDSTLEYDPAADEWAERRAMPTARSDLAAVAFGGKIHVFGGLRRLPLLGKFTTARHEVYDPLRDVWVRKRALPEAACGLGAAALGNRLSVAGGEQRWLLRLWGRSLTARHLSYHPATDGWQPELEPLPAPRRDVALVEIYGRLFAIGGRAALGWLADCDQYDPATGRWVALTPLHEPIDSPGVAAADGALYVIGARRGPEAGGVLVEECRIASRFYVHRHEPDGGGPAAAEARRARGGTAPRDPWEDDPEWPTLIRS